MYFFFVFFKFFLQGLHFNFSQISLLLQTSYYFILIFYFVFELINMQQIIIKLFLHTFVFFHYIRNHLKMFLFLFFKSLFKIKILSLNLNEFLILFAIFCAISSSCIICNIDIQILNAIYIIDLRVTRVHSINLLSEIHNIILLIHIFVFFLFFTFLCQLLLKLAILKF